MNLKTNKKGIAIIPILLLGMILLLVVGIFFIKLDPITTRVYNIADNYVAGSTVAQNIITQRENDSHTFWDAAFLFMFAGIWFSCLIIGYYSDYGNFVLVIMILLMAIMGWVASDLSDYWIHVSSQSDVSTVVNYPYTYFILDNFLWMIILVMGSAVIVSIVRDY